MTQLLMKESSNPNFVYLVNADNPTTKLIGFTKQELTDPLAINRVPETGQPADRKIVRILKIGAQKINGFETWQEAKTFVEAISDVNVVLAANGLTLEEALDD